MKIVKREINEGIIIEAGDIIEGVSSGNVYIVTINKDDEYILVNMSDGYLFDVKADSALELVNTFMDGCKYKVHKSKNVTLTIS